MDALHELLMKHMEKKLDEDNTKMLHIVFNKSSKQHPKKTAAVWPLNAHLASHPRKMSKKLLALLLK